MGTVTYQDTDAQEWTFRKTMSPLVFIYENQAPIICIDHITFLFPSPGHQASSGPPSNALAIVWKWSFLHQNNISCQIDVSILDMIHHFDGERNCNCNRIAQGSMHWIPRETHSHSIIWIWGQNRGHGGWCLIGIECNEFHTLGEGHARID